MPRNNADKNKSKRSFPLLRRFDSRSISRDLTVGLIITVVLISSIAISISYFNASRNARIQLEGKAGELIISLSNVLSIPLWNFDEEIAIGIGESYAYNEFVVKLKIVDSLGTVYLEIDKEVDVPLISRSNEVLHKDKPVGHVDISLTSHYYKKISRQFMWSSAFTILLNLISLMIMIRFLLRRFLQNPLNYFSEVVSSYGLGHYDLPEKYTPAIEFQPFVDVLNEMKDKIEAQMSELQKAHDELEQRVAERTSELAYTNKQLMQEIEERKRGEKALRKSEAQYRAVVEDQTEMICRFIPDGTLTFANDAYCRYFAVKTEKLIGYSFMPLMAIENREFVKKQFSSLCLEKSVVTYEHRVSMSEGDIRWHQWTGRAIFDHKDELIEYQAVGQDITNRKFMDSQLKASLQEKEILLKEIHHRVKNNMQVISSLLKIQLGHIKDKQVAEMFKDSQDRITSMSLVHEQLFQSEDLSNIDFESYVRKLVSNLHSSYGPDAGKIAVNIESKDVFLGIDAAIPCGLVINELVSNSFKYAFPAGREGVVSIDLQLADDNIVELIIGDNGIGIPESLVGHGDTLGLQLVTNLVEHQLSGEIEVRRNGGTEFRIKFKNSDGNERI